MLVRMPTQKEPPLRAGPISGPSRAVTAAESSRGWLISGTPTRQAQVIFLQHAVGNAATGQLLAAARPSNIQRQPVTAGPAGKPSAPPAAAGSGDTIPDNGMVPDTKAGTEIRQGAIGDVILPLPNVNVVDGQQTKKDWKKGISAGTLFTVPIPKLPGATVGIVVLGEIEATFTADYGPGRFQNLRVGMSKLQAAELVAGAAYPVLFGPNAMRVLYQGPFTAIGDFHLPASVGLRMFARAGVGLSGRWVGVELIKVAASLEAELNSQLGKEKPFEDQVSIYYANGDLRFRAQMDRTLQFNLGMALNAALTAEILKIWKWERRWRLTQELARSIDMTKWPTRVRVSLSNESHGMLPMRSDTPALNALIIPGETKITVGVDEGDLNTDALLKRLFNESDKQGNQNEVTQNSGQGGGSPGGGRGGHVAPTGTRDDPIPMTWYKPLHWYLDPVTLRINGEKREFRRNSKAMLPHGEAIGVSYWPSNGDLIQLTTPTRRTGRMQADFSAALLRYGFPLAGWNADHVEDLAMGGFDDFDNLWPLEAGVNQRAGNWQLGQPVRFSKDTEPMGNVYGPIAIQGQDYLRGRYFRIRDTRDPPP